MGKKEIFLEEHNKLSPDELKVTLFTLSHFKEEKPNLFKKVNWSIEKLRRPFVFWLTSLTKEQRKKYREE